MGSHLLRGKPDSFDGLSEATPTELQETRREEDPRGGISGKKQLCDHQRNICRGVIGSKDVFFWPEVLENTEKTDSNEIQTTAEGIREDTGWEYPVDKNSLYALCQLHEVYVDEKRRRTDDAAGPSKTPESWLQR